MFEFTQEETFGLLSDIFWIVPLTPLRSDFNEQKEQKIKRALMVALVRLKI